MTAFALAWRSTTRSRARAILAIVGIAVIGALLFDMLLLSRGLLVSFGDLLNDAGFDVRIVAGEGFSRVPVPRSFALAAAVRALPGVDDVEVVRAEEGRAQAGNGAVQRLTIVGRTPSRTSPWRLLEGRDASGTDPAGPCAGVVDRPLANVMSLTVGTVVQVTATPGGARTALPPLVCRVDGIADFDFSAAGEHAFGTSMATLQRALGETTPGDADVVLIQTSAGADREGVVRAIDRLRPDVRAYSNEAVLEQFNRNGFAYFRQISLVLSTLTTAFAFLLVATLLTVSLNQRLGEIAALRAVGIRRWRIASMLWWESALLVGTGALAAVPLGGAIAVALDRILRQMPGLPGGLHFFVFDRRALFVHVAVFAVTACASAAYPIWLAARLPIAETLRREVVG